MSNATTTDRYQSARQKLETAGQAHVLNFYDQLRDAEKQQLLDQVEAIDWNQIARLIKSHVLAKPELKLDMDKVEPAPWYPYAPTADLRDKYEKARARGEQLLREGKVAAFTVAGGQGTRLGWDGPKGTFPATPIRKLPLFGCMAEYLIKAQQKFGKTIPWYIMTSPINHQATVEFLKNNDYFGLDPANVMIFPQAMMPAFDMQTGRVLLESPDSLALSPNGHGGSLQALSDSGALADMKKRGVEQISYTQIDNPNVKVVDPLFLGLHELDGAQMSSKMLPKAYPKEKLGNLCTVDGRVTVIEYSDLPDELAEQRTDDGELRFRAGSIALHAIRRDFVESLNAGGELRLPFHRAEKKVPHVDPKTGEPIKPTEPNAVKVEMFVFDALPMCETSIVYETDRVEEFAPIKNATGGDSAESARALQVQRAARWLKAVGVVVPEDENGQPAATIEIKHTTAIEPEDLRDAKLPHAIERGEEVLL